MVVDYCSSDFDVSRVTLQLVVETTSASLFFIIAILICHGVLDSLGFQQTGKVKVGSRHLIS